VIRRGVELEARLIDDLLDVTRVVHGKLLLDRVAVDVHELVHQTLGICRSDLHGKHMRLNLALDAGRRHVEGDPARLQQVLWNLIKNAVKFSPDGGTVSVRTRNEPGASPDEPPRLVLDVTDTGIGIEPDALPRIFNAFEQGEAAITRRFGGLGLGLAISRSVAEAHGGRLSATSAGKGRGATFRLELVTKPSAVPTPAAAETPRPGAAPRRSLRILLVEDDLPSLRVMTRLLQQRGHAVTTADSVASAAEAAARDGFDLLISDIGLPDGTGLDLIARLRAASIDLRAIALTGFGMDDDIRRSREAGFLAHLTKPVNFPALETLIQQLAAEG
jgi:CheY-like chemotaxis protein